MRSLLLLVVCCAGMAGIQTDVQPLRINDEARSLSRRSVQEILRLAARDGKAVWLLEGNTSQTLPEKRFIDAYLEPDASGPRLRRGRVASLESRIVRGVAVRWRVPSRVGKYAQVSREPNSWPAFLNDLSMERPFMVIGDFADEELISLVSLVRGSPKLEGNRVVDPKGTTRLRLPDGLDGGMPITLVRRKGSSVTVVLQDSTRSGQTATLSRAGHTWNLVGANIWVM